MKVYLAGKVSKNCWRHEFVDDLKNINAMKNEAWPILRNSIRGCIDYCGPYFVSCDHGCTHGPYSHGAVMECGSSWEHAEDFSGNNETRKSVFNKCMFAIHMADVFIAKLDKECYGTMIELGYARSIMRAKKGCIYIVPPDNAFSEADMWFATQCGTVKESVNDVIDELESSLKPKSLDYLCDSPIEKMFYSQLVKLGATNFVPQVQAGKYRIDFADEKLMFGIEIDGFDYHSTKQQIINDRSRQRELESMGWRIVRFAGSEVYKDAHGCVLQCLELMQKHKSQIAQSAR